MCGRMQVIYSRHAFLMTTAALCKSDTKRASFLIHRPPCLIFSCVWNKLYNRRMSCESSKEWKTLRVTLVPTVFLDSILNIAFL
jgi:hypothetical protein